MPLADLLNIPETDKDRDAWSFAHQDAHLKIVNAIYAQNKSNLLPLYILDPMPKGNELSEWLQIHQAAHTEFTSALGIGGNDLSDVDWSKPDQVASFIRLHFEEHFLAQQRLGYED